MFYHKFNLNLIEVEKKHVHRPLIVDIEQMMERKIDTIGYKKRTHKTLKDSADVSERVFALNCISCSFMRLHDNCWMVTLCVQALHRCEIY